MKRIYSRLLFFVAVAFSNVALASHVGQLAVIVDSSLCIVTDDFFKKKISSTEEEIPKMNTSSHITALGGFFKYHYVSDSFFVWTTQLGYLHRNSYISFSSKDSDLKGIIIGKNDSTHVIRILNGPAVNFLSDNDNDAPKFILGFLFGSSVNIYTQEKTKDGKEEYGRSWAGSGIIGLNIEYISESGFFGSIVPTFETFNYALKAPNYNNNSGSNEEKIGRLYFVNFELQVGWNIFNF